MFRPNSDKLENQLLKVQHLTIRYADTQLYVVDGADIVVLIGQPVADVVSGTHQAAAGGADGAGLTTKAAAALTIVDKDSPYALGGDLSAIRVATVTMAAGDVLRLEYIMT